MRLCACRPVPLRRSWSFSLFRRLAINHPRNPEAVDKHAESLGPEGLLKRHVHRSTFCQRLKDPFSLRRAFEAERYREPLRFLIVLARGIGAHEHLITCLKRDM